MASIYPVFFYISTVLRAPVAATNSSSVISSLTLRKGDSLPLYVSFTKTASSLDNAMENLTTYGKLYLTAKSNNDWDGTTVLFVTNFTATTSSSLIGVSAFYGAEGASANTFYSATLDLSGTTLASLFAATNTPSVTLHGEFEWLDRVDGVTYRTTSQRFNLIVQNEITKN